MKKDILKKYKALKNEVVKTNGFYNSLYNVVNDFGAPNEMDCKMYKDQMKYNPFCIITITEDKIYFETSSGIETRTYFDLKTLRSTIHTYISKSILKNSFPNRVCIYKYVSQFDNCSRLYDVNNASVNNYNTCIVRCCSVAAADIVVSELKEIFGYNYKRLIRK